ncbi:MAG: hypothetical protein ABI837_02760 [Acidobacteriota bacterium]
MNLSVTDRVSSIATFRAIEIQLMEMLATWTPTTAEMEAKVLFGRHIWDLAQHADALGKRTFELRRPEHYTLAPADDYSALLAEVAAVRPTAGRLDSFYDGLLPGCRRRYVEYLAVTDPILDEPTIVILKRIVTDIDRQRADAVKLRGEIALAASSPDQVVAADARIANVVAGERKAS